MVDTGVSKAPAFGYAGSSPAPGTFPRLDLLAIEPRRSGHGDRTNSLRGELSEFRTIAQLQRLESIGVALGYWLKHFTREMFCALM
jgi:hypothetical protein